MKIEYVCHACLFVETSDALIVTDPWFRGSVYCNQWHVFPKPVDTEKLATADFILISHGHEDHLQQASIQDLKRSAQVFYPYNWYTSVKPYINDLGFARVQEAITNRTYRLTDSTSVTYIANNLDSLMVIESDGRVLVNANDALHPHHPNVIDMFVEAIRARWPKIDVLFCGFGGASYFPNSIHVPGKNDVEIGKLREQVFVHNFCRIVAGLQPDVAVPFAADYVVLDPGKTWMNHIRIPRERIAAYFRDNFQNSGPPPTIHAMYPGDVLENNQLQAKSPYRGQLREGSLDHLIDVQYSAELAAKRQVKMLDESSADKLCSEIQANVQQRSHLFSADTLRDLQFCVRASDVADCNCYNIRFIDGQAAVDRTAEPVRDTRIVVDISSVILRYSFASTWGGDAITIGYGAEINVVDPAAVEEKLDTICIRLLVRHPVATRHMRQHPLRAARFLLHNPLTRKWAVKRLTATSSLNAIYDQNLWLRRTKCEVCQVCDMPLLDDQFASQLKVPTISN